MDRTTTSGFRSQLAQRKLLSLTLLLFTLAIGIVIGTVLSRDVSAAREGVAAAPDAKPLKMPDPVKLENEFTRVAKEARATVVHIQVEQLPKKTEAREPEPENPNEDMFRRFFGLPDPFGGPGDQRRRRPGEGSGVIVDESGYIITNYHVVEKADRIRVRLFRNGDPGDVRHDAQLIGFDPETDLAVIKVNAGRPLKNIPIGNSDAVQVGDWALAVGSPFGYEETVTVGIISALAREVDGNILQRSTFQRFLQTDAAINPGNSGGPLLNIRGELIGVNTAIVSRSGGSEGLGFAMPSRAVVNVYNQIIRHGKVRRGSIGISFGKEQHPALLRSFGAEDGGVLVTTLTEGGPAEKAGMKEEDVIVEIAGNSIKDGEELIATVAAQEVGSSVPIVVLRDGKRQTLNVEIADRSVLFRTELGYDANEAEKGPEGTEVMFGLEVSNLSASKREQIQFDQADGVAVTGVDPASFADDIGVMVDDIIVMINRRPVASIDDVQEIQAELKPGDDVAIKIMRRGPSREAGKQFEWRAQYLAGVLPADKGRF
ncbi:MAG TPA: Do family serine endopeptidase [Bryobacterales bacterium]|nr:Do family serine endopeptidase [Bryobacterales bacterium]